MRELLTLWKDTRMILLVAVVAAVYAAVLLPFKVFTILPGLTEIRPANVFPVIFSLMFGPAAAWGSAIGNLIGDIFGGTFGPGSLGGFVGNFFFGLVGYKIWGNLRGISSGAVPDFRSDRVRQLAEYVIIAVAAAAVCAAIIAWWVDFLGLVPFAVIGPIIITNNAIAAIILGPPLLYLTYPRIARMGLLYTDIMPQEDIDSAVGGAAGLGALLLIVVPLVWLAVGVYAGFAPESMTQAAIGAVLFVITVVSAYLARERMSQDMTRTL